MKEIKLEELKKIELELLKQFRNVCDSNGFRYALYAGTLLGAARHKGFIPWDDDIDVFMPRPDYDSFLNYCKENDNTEFRVASKVTLPDYYYLYSKVYNDKTILIEEVTDANSDQRGVYIDVFPIDGLGNTLEEACKKSTKSLFKRKLLVASFWKKYFLSKTHPLYIEPIRVAFYLLGKLVNQEKLLNSIEILYSNIDFDNAEYCGCVCGSYGKREIMPKKLFTELTNLEFEGELFKAPKDYDAFLTRIYGDYMQLPPEEKRKTHHMFEAHWKE